MEIFRNTSKDGRHRIRNTFINLLLAVSIPVGIFFIYTILISLLAGVIPGFVDNLNPQLNCWWANSKYGRAIGMRHCPTYWEPEYGSHSFDQSHLDPKVYNYTLTISDRAQWPQPDFAAKYRGLLNELRSGRQIHRRSHIQEPGTRVTCWLENWELGGGFYSRHVSPVELDWLDLPRFQDTLRSQDPLSERKFCDKFKKLLPFYYVNNTWYDEIVNLDEKYSRDQLLGCEPGFIRRYEAGFLADVDTISCYKRSPLVAWQKEGSVDVMWHLEQPKWVLEDGGWGAEALNLGVAGRIRNALTMEEKARAIELSGGVRLVSEELKNFWGCWYDTANMDCSDRGGYKGYRD